VAAPRRRRGIVIVAVIDAHAARAADLPTPATVAGRRAFHCAIVEPNSLPALASEWAALASRSVSDNAFFHPDFALLAIACLGSGVVLATVAGDDGRLVAAAPVRRGRLGRIAPAVRLWSHDYGPLGSPLVEAAVCGPALDALIEGLSPPGSGIGLVAPDLPLDGPVAAAMIEGAARAGRPVRILDRRERAVCRRAPGGPADVRATLPARRRKEYARQLRRLGDSGPVAFETATDPDRVMARFEEFLAVEAAGWKGRRGTALASSATTAEFGRAVVFNHARSGRARIDSLRLGDHPLAVVVSFVAGATAWTWKIAYDETYARYSPGAQLMLRVPESLFGDPAVDRIDSCAAPDHPMIDHLWRRRMTLGTLVVGPPGGGALHRLGLAAEEAELAARARARRLRARLG
jgi:CelD/BcsL family acetyltransferase involved in cellulose biosynthesis